MNQSGMDIRVKVGWAGHRKTRKLARLVGGEGPWKLVQLWEHAALEAQDGYLRGYTDEDIAAAATWPEHDSAAFVGALRECGWLEDRDGIPYLHDWPDHQPWMVHAPIRHEIAKKAAAVRWNKKRGVNAQSTARGNAHSNAPAPTPSPTPVPSPALNTGGADLYRNLGAIGDNGHPEAPKPVYASTPRSDPDKLKAAIARHRSKDSGL